MAKVTKEKNWGTSDVINIQTENGNFYIAFEKNLNLYFSYLGNNMEDEKDTCSFMVDDSDKFLYQQFNELYDAVMSQKPFKYSDSLNTNYDYSLNKLPKNLVEGNEIRWHSDESDYEVASVLLIKKEKNSFIVTFKKGRDDEFDRTTYKVCMKNGGSRYDPYNVSFMILYNNLKEHDFQFDVEYGKSKVRTR